MGSDGTARDPIGDGIDRLEDAFGSFPVNQTTLSVGTSDYDTARERGDNAVYVYVRVRNDEGEVLHLRDADEPSVPRYVRNFETELRPHVREWIREETGVECAVSDVTRATIAGVHDESDPDAPPLYRLLVLVDADYEGGTPDGAVWEAGDAAIPEYV